MAGISLSVSGKYVALRLITIKWDSRHSGNIAWDLKEKALRLGDMNTHLA